MELSSPFTGKVVKIYHKAPCNDGPKSCPSCPLTTPYKVQDTVKVGSTLVDIEVVAWQEGMVEHGRACTFNT